MKGRRQGVMFRRLQPFEGAPQKRYALRRIATRNGKLAGQGQTDRMVGTSANVASRERRGGG